VDELSIKTEKAEKILAEGSAKINEYLDLFFKLGAGEFNVGVMLKRFELCRKYSYAVPNRLALKTIHEQGKILEIGSGNGYWAYLLREFYNTDIICTDAHPVPTGTNFHFGYDVKKEYVDDIIFPTRALMEWVAKDRALFICWPTYDTEWAFEWVKMYMDYGGQTLIYIGEGQGGGCADDNFFCLLDQCFEKDKLNWSIPQWDGIHDYFEIYRVKSRDKWFIKNN